jgi:hypothetical protein
MACANKRPSKAILWLLSSQPYAYNWLVDSVSRFPVGMAYMTQHLSMAFMQGIKSSKPEDRELCSYLRRLANSEPRSAAAQAVYMLSSCFEGSVEDMVLQGIREKNVAVVQGALKAGKLRVSHLDAVYRAEAFAEVYDEIDKAFGPAVLADLTFSEGYALCYMGELLRTGTHRAKAAALELLSEAASLTNMQLLSRLYALSTLRSSEMEAVNLLPAPLNSLFLADPAWLLPHSSLIYPLVRELHKTHYEPLLQDLLLKISQAVWLQALDDARHAKDEYAVSYLSEFVRRHGEGL